MPYETDLWPLIEASQHGPKRTGGVDLIVIHDMEFFERMDTAEVIARDFARRTAANAASAHICVDSDSIVQSVPDSYVAYAAPGANHNGYQIELAGYGSQNLKQWMDEYGWMLLNRGARAAAQIARKYSVPIVKLSPLQVKNGYRGVCGHWDVSRAFGKSDHTDPGPNFPWDYFVQAMKTFYQSEA